MYAPLRLYLLPICTCLSFLTLTSIIIIIVLVTLAQFVSHDRPVDLHPWIYPISLTHSNCILLALLRMCSKQSEARNDCTSFAHAQRLGACAVTTHCSSFHTVRLAALSNNLLHLPRQILRPSNPHLPSYLLPLPGHHYLCVLLPVHPHIYIM